MMHHPRCWSRRSVNMLLAGAAAWSCDGTAWQLPSSQFSDQKSLQLILLSLFENCRSAYAIGLACLKALPPNPSALQQLVNVMIASADCTAGVTKTKDVVRRCIDDRVRHDFAEGAVVNIDGWLLSSTEARLYALVALSLKSWA